MESLEGPSPDELTILMPFQARSLSVLLTIEIDAEYAFRPEARLKSKFYADKKIVF